jgi:methylenetetrahydrofolate reductase (NADPH)
MFIRRPTLKVTSFPSLTFIAVNKDGESLSNIAPNAVNAVTWGGLPWQGDYPA